MVSKRREAWKGHWCAGQVYDGRAGFHPCANRGKYLEGGKGYCGIHLPSKVDAKRSAREKKWKEEWAAERARIDHNTLVERAEAVLVREVLGRKVHQDDLPEWIEPFVEDVRKARAAL